jgi:hypothetical protein
MTVWPKLLCSTPKQAMEVVQEIEGPQDNWMMDYKATAGDGML